jgi:hypothetical protein
MLIWYRCEGSSKGLPQATTRTFSNKVRIAKMNNIKTTTATRSRHIEKQTHSPPNSLSDILSCLATQNPDTERSEEITVLRVRKRLLRVCCEISWLISDSGLVVETSFFGRTRHVFMRGWRRLPRMTGSHTMPKGDDTYYPCIMWVSYDQGVLQFWQREWL